MPRTKNALIRQRVIDRCLSSINDYSIKDMMDACNKELEFIGEHPVTAMNTIREDIEQIMANYPDANVVSRRVGRNVFYSYEDRTYSIFNIPFNDDEVAQLTQTLSILSRFEGMPQFEWMNDFIDRFKSSLKLSQSNEPIVGFDENIDLRGRSYFTLLFAAISNKQVLIITYKNFKRDIEQKFIVHPYYLKQFNGRWFLVGYSSNINRLSLFAFDRIVSVENSHTEFIHNTEYDFNEYFDDMIGVTKPDGAVIEKVVLWVSTQRWPTLVPEYLATYFQTSLYRDEIEQLGSGSNILNIKPDHIYDLQLPIPLYGEQMAFVSIVKQADKSGFELRKSIDVTDRKSLIKG